MKKTVDYIRFKDISAGTKRNVSFIVSPDEHGMTVAGSLPHGSQITIDKVNARLLVTYLNANVLHDNNTMVLIDLVAYLRHLTTEEKTKGNYECERLLTKIFSYLDTKL